ncbi:MAG: PQQ-binding-like beta-propeller repeat protein [Bryobacteraceae bacterium]|nr:PQQ-binding-like beta-propeller repeat protein [Bryobacteraceae bacterium]
MFSPGFAAFLTAALLAAAPVPDTQWTRFRGPNGSGVADAKNLPVEFGPSRNLVWKTEILPGYSSPALTEKQIFVTAHKDKKKLYTICLDRKTGQILWQHEAGENPNKPLSVNTPVSPTPVTDGVNAYVFFEHAGLISYSPDGKERWRAKLGPFQSPYGLGASPILINDKVILQIDHDNGSFLVAFRAKDGKQLWRTPRNEFTHGFSTPVVYKPKKGPAQIVTSGSFKLAGYSAADGELLWWLDGMAWQAKSTPLIDGDTLYVHSWMAGLTDLGHKPVTETWPQILEKADANKDSKLQKEELPDPSMAKYLFLFDLDGDGTLGERDWNNVLARNNAKNGLYAIKLGEKAKGDIKANILWRYDKSLPNIPSPVLYNGALFILKEGGILTALNPQTGEVVKQGRIEGAVDPYFASPVAADGKLYTASAPGNIAVLKAAPQWELLAVNKLDEETWATPAIAGQNIYVRTQKSLYCFGVSQPAP